MRHLALLVAPAVLALAAGCSGGGGGNDSVWETPKVAVAPSAVASGPVISADARATCAKATKISTAFGGTFMVDLRDRIESASKGAAARGVSQTKLERDVNEYSAAMAGLARKTGDAAVKKALKQLSTQAKALKGDFRKINAKKMSALSASLDKACGRS